MINIGVIGCGHWGPNHIRIFSSLKDSKVGMCADLDEERLKAIKENFPNIETTAEYKDILKKTDIDAVCVCSPSGLHAEHAVGVANAGKHVIVEKSIAINLRDATDMILAARDNNVKLGVIFQKRTEEAPNRIKKAIEDGVFGRIVFADVSTKYWRDQAYYDSGDWRGTWAQEGGGSTITQGIHGIDLMLYMMGDVEKIYAKYDMVAHERIEVEDLAIAILTYKNGKSLLF